MRPEQVTYPTPQTEAYARQQFEAVTGQLAAEYPKGQNMISDVWDWARRRPSARDRIAPLAAAVKPARAFLAEIQGRIQTPALPTDGEFRDQLAANISTAHAELGNEVFERVADATHSTGRLGEAYRAYLRSDAFRLVGGIGLYLAANQFGWITGDSGVLATEAAVISTGLGALDMTRRGLLQATKNRLGGIMATMSGAIGRKASVQERMITGDLGHDPDQVFNADVQLYGMTNAQQVLLEDDLRDQLTAKGVRRPQTAPIGSTTYAPELRDVITPAMERADETEALVDARESARGSRLLRTVLATALVAGVGYAHLTRPIICGVSENPDPSQESVDRFGQPNRLSMQGKAEAVAYQRRYGEDFDKNNPAHQSRIAGDRQESNYQRRIDSIGQEISDANPGLEWADEDRFLADDVYIPCPPAYQGALRRLQTRIPQFDVDFSGGRFKITTRP